MDLQQVKDTLNKAGFSEESLKMLNQILDQAIARGSISQEEKTKLLGIIDIEIEGANIEADTMEDVAMALESFADDVDRVTDKAADDLENIDKDLSSDIDSASIVTENPPTPSQVTTPPTATPPPTPDPNPLPSSS
ncbi:MAG: hypothetical protein AAB583_02100 [Patescibacteria group bacterium]